MPFAFGQVSRFKLPIKKASDRLIQSEASGKLYEFIRYSEAYRQNVVCCSLSSWDDAGVPF